MRLCRTGANWLLAPEGEVPAHHAPLAGPSPARPGPARDAGRRLIGAEPLAHPAGGREYPSGRS